MKWTTFYLHYQNNMSEKLLHQSVCHYIRAQYPHVIFTSESSGLRVSKGLANSLALTRSHNGLPDLWIMYPNWKYYGLFIELKTVSPFKKDGSLKKNEHTQKQARILNDLCNLNYYARFATGMDEAVALIDAYIKSDKSKLE